MARGQKAPEGIWEHAGGHTLPFRAELAIAAGGQLIVSDRQHDVLALRVDSGVVSWRRSLEPGAEVSLHPLILDDGEAVLVSHGRLSVYRVDVGTRLWERSLWCQANRCDERLLHAGTSGLDGEEAILIATGGRVQNAIERLDPRTGTQIWRVEVGHPRRVAVSEDAIAIEEAQSPFRVRFFNLKDGQELGHWDRIVDGVPRPLSDLYAYEGRFVAVDLRPTEGSLAHVMVLGRTGIPTTERHIPRPALLAKSQSLPAASDLVRPGLGVFTPNGSQGAALTLMRLQDPWTARTEPLYSSAKPVVVGQKAFSLSPEGEHFTLTTLAETRESMTLTGFHKVPAVSALDSRTLLLYASPEQGRTDLGASLVTVTRDEARELHGIGAPELNGELLSAFRVGGDVSLVVRAGSEDRVERLVFIPWDSAIQKLKSAAARGADVASYVRRMARHYPIQEMLGAAVDLRERPAALTLSDREEALLVGLRQMWLEGRQQQTVEGMRELVDATESKDGHKRALLNAYARLIIDLILAPAARLKEDAQPYLTGLARSLEWESCPDTSCEGGPIAEHIAGVYTGVLMQAGESLMAADLLAKAEETPMVVRAREEVARQALGQLRRSVGTKVTETNRVTLVAGLNFFRHLDLALGARSAEVRALMAQAERDISALPALQSALQAAEGPQNQKITMGPEACTLACESARKFCGREEEARASCETRCTKGQGVRFVSGGRASSNPRWFCE